MTDRNRLVFLGSSIEPAETVEAMPNTSVAERSAATVGYCPEVVDELADVRRANRNQLAVRTEVVDRAFEVALRLSDPLNRRLISPRHLLQMVLRVLS